METCTRVIDGCTLTVPNEPWMVLPHPRLDDYTDCCGSGEPGSATERIVPEHILGLRMSVCCYVHDWWWMMCVRTMDEFRQSNRVMVGNMLEINRVHGGGWFKRILRVPVIYGWGLALGTRKALENFLR